MLPPPRHQQKPNLNDLMQQIEEDALSNAAWRLISALPAAIEALSALPHRLFSTPEPTSLPHPNCPEPLG